MKLSKWCKEQGISYMTGFRWFHAGKIPGSRQMDSGTILVDETPIKSIENNNKVWIYCRVSNQNRKKEIQYQVDRCKEFCIARGYEIVAIHKEIASGMNDNRKELWKLLDSKPTKIIIENKDRLTRFGFNYLERLLKRLECEIVVINCENNDETDLIKDLVSIITSFCCRLYGIRRSSNKVKRIKEVLDDKSF